MLGRSRLRLVGYRPVVCDVYVCTAPLHYGRPLHDMVKLYSHITTRYPSLLLQHHNVFNNLHIECFDKLPAGGSRPEIKNINER